MLRLGAGERGVTEILGITEHVNSISSIADGLRLRPDVPHGPEGAWTELISPPPDPPEDARPTLAEIDAWSRDRLDMDRAPAFWRAISHRPRFLRALWRKDRLVLGAGRLEEPTKMHIALAVAMNGHSAYWTGYYVQLGRRAGALDDDKLIELAACVSHYVSFNTIANGMRLEPDADNLTAESPG